MNLKQFARSYEWSGVTFWLIPYRRMETETAIAELNELEPQMVYINTKTKERVFEKPDDLKRAEDRAAAMHTDVKSVWEARDLWRAIHRCFVICESATVAIDFPDSDVSAQVAALCTYWNERSPIVAERWQVFKALMSTDVCNAWWEAFYATRDNPAPAAPELGQAAPPTDPLPPTDGDESTTDTSALSRAS